MNGRPVPRLVAAVVAGGLALAACGGDSDATSDTTIADATDTTATATESTVAEADNGAGETAGADVTAATVDGGQFDLGSLEGRDTILWFWAPW